MPQKERTDLMIQREAQDFDRMMAADRARKRAAKKSLSRHPVLRLSQKLSDLQSRVFTRTRR